MADFYLPFSATSPCPTHYTICKVLYFFLSCGTSAGQVVLNLESSRTTLSDMEATSPVT